MKRREIVFRPTFRRFEVEDPIEPSTSQQRRTTRTKKTGKSIIVETKSINEEPIRSFGRAVKKTYNEFREESTIHGVPYLRKSSKPLEKVFWLLLLLISFIICLYLIRVQYQRWERTPVILTFSEREVPVSHIPFPAVTICTETKFVITETINFTRFFNYLSEFRDTGRIVTPPPWMSDDDFVKMRALLQVCGSYIAAGLNFPEYPPITVTDHLNEIAPPFEKTFGYCKFNQTRGDCGPLFEKVYTEEGICYTFNALNESELYRKDTYQYRYFEVDKHIRKRKKDLDWEITKGFMDVDDYDTYPERVLGSGLTSGLVAILRGHPEDTDYICRGPVQGFKVVLHSPDEVPIMDKHFFLVPYRQDTLILVTPYMSYTTKELKKSAPATRNCYYPRERYLRFFQFYTQNNCEIECLANFTLKQCGCVQFAMPRLRNTAVCDAAQIHCYNQAENAFLLSEYTNLGNKDDKCDCLPGCFTLDYNVELSYGVFNMDKLVEAHNDEELINMYKGKNVSRVSIYFRSNEFTAFKRSEFFGLADFLAHVGGLFGLMMGVTAINFMEFIHLWTVRLFHNTKDALKK